MIRWVEHDALNLEYGLYRNDYGRVLVRWNQYSDMADAGVFDKVIEFNGVLGINQGAVSRPSDTSFDLEKVLQSYRTVFKSKDFKCSMFSG